jgi:hypothetical protein
LGRALESKATLFNPDKDGDLILTLRVMLLGIGSSTSWPNIKVDEAFSTPESLFNEILFPSTTTSSLGLSVSAALALSSGMPTEAN